MIFKLGRNDLCHCGSGKKYKKCHLDEDQRSRAAVRPSQPEPEPPSTFTGNLPTLFRQLSERGPAGERREGEELISKAEPIIEYLAHQSEIEDAEAELEAHRAEFEKLVADEEHYLAVAQAVFAEECFTPLRFTASDVQRAFDHVGYPAMMSPDKRTGEILRAAILHVADKDRRARLSMRLLVLLPEFVAAGRHLEAWLVQCVAISTTEDCDESNAFLFKMFAYGYEAWTADKQAKDESLLRELGLDPDELRAMSLEELDSWMRSHASDPANAGAVEEFFRKNPHLREESIANLEAMERHSGRLLDREDSRFLYLPADEVQPWLALYSERIDQHGLLASPQCEASVRKIFEEETLPLMREMADSIFSPERMRRLIEDLRKYRSDLFAAGDKSTAGQVLGAINYLEREDCPNENFFLLSLCWASLNAAIEAATAETGRSADG